MASWAGTYQLNIAALQSFIAGLRNAGTTGPIVGFAHPTGR
jgi:hypothetical protein